MKTQIQLAFKKCVLSDLTLPDSASTSLRKRDVLGFGFVHTASRAPVKCVQAGIPLLGGGSPGCIELTKCAPPELGLRKKQM